MAQQETSQNNQSSQRKQNNQNDEDERLDLIILANAKKEGLSFKELNEFRVSDYIKFSEIYTDSQPNNGKARQNYTKQATQSDIDTLLS